MNLFEFVSYSNHRDEEWGKRIVEIEICTEKLMMVDAAGIGNVNMGMS
jgi:hypothetical protein